MRMAKSFRDEVSDFDFGVTPVLYPHIVRVRPRGKANGSKLLVAGADQGTEGK
jgi:hypothetical protein